MSSGSGRDSKNFQKLFSEFMSFFENPGNNFRITEEVSGSGDI
jgi:hypothetical protein